MKTYKDFFVTEAQSLGIDAAIIDHENQTIAFSKNGIPFLWYDNQWSIQNEDAVRLANNKTETYRILRSVGLPVLDFISINFLDQNWNIELKKFLKETGFPLVVKVVDSCQGFGVFPDVRDITELTYLLNGFVKNKVKECLIDRFVIGDVYRILVIGDEKVLSFQKIYPTVIGDGNCTISELIEDFAIRQIKTIQAKLTFDSPIIVKSPMVQAKIEMNLNKNNLTLNSIPAKNEKIILHYCANMPMGSTIRDTTDLLDESVNILAKKAAKTIGLNIAGVDIVIDKEHRPYILEVNADPCIAGHLSPHIGVPRPAGKQILKYCLNNKITD